MNGFFSIDIIGHDGVPTVLLVEDPTMRRPTWIGHFDLAVGMPLVVVVYKIVEQLAEIHVRRRLGPESGEMGVIRSFLEFKTDDPRVAQLIVFRLIDVLVDRVMPLL